MSIYVTFKHRQKNNIEGYMLYGDTYNKTINN